MLQNQIELNHESFALSCSFVSNKQLFATKNSIPEGRYGPKTKTNEGAITNLVSAGSGGHLVMLTRSYTPGASIFRRVTPMDKSTRYTIFAKVLLKYGHKLGMAIATMSPKARQHYEVNE